MSHPCGRSFQPSSVQHCLKKTMHIFVGEDLHCILLNATAEIYTILRSFMCGGRQCILVVEGYLS